MVDRDRCVILVPTIRYIEPETHDCLLQMRALGYQVRFLRGCSQVDLARSILASWACDEGYLETLWVDSDVVFTPDDVERIRSHDQPFVAGLYVKKGKPEFAGMFQHEQEVQFGAHGGLVEMEYVGMGFTLVKTEVYHRIARKLRLPKCGGGYDPTRKITPYFIPTVVLRPVPNGPPEYSYLSEDYSLCHRARLSGYKIMADTAIKLGHLATTPRTWDVMFHQGAPESITVSVHSNYAENQPCQASAEKPSRNNSGTSQSSEQPSTAQSNCALAGST